jgi:acetylornithine deacetylase/succinyl-diaminopimelate desuccinylase-like protein
MEKVVRYIEDHEASFLKDIETLCNQKSISETGEGMKETAELLRGMLEELGAEVCFSDPDSPCPIIYGEIPGEATTSVLFYNHYDTLPAGELSLWETNPFVTEIRGGRIFARGVSDNKGDIMSRIHAVRAFLETRGRLPVTVKFLWEAGEYDGSPDLPSYFAEHAGDLKVDVALWEGGKVDASGRPMMHLGTKGVIQLRLTAENQHHPMHVMYGALVENPAWRLIWALATLKAPDETVLVEGFEDDIQELGTAVENLVKRIPFDERAFQKDYGISRFVLGETGEKLKRRYVLSPHCTVTLIEAGMPWIVPAKATAIVAFGLVPDQDPDDIYNKVRKHLRKSGFADVKAELIEARRPSRSSPESAPVRLAKEALEKVHGLQAVIFPYSPGMGSCYLMGETPVLHGLGVAWDGDNVHGPNENIRVEDYVNATKALCWFLELCGHNLMASTLAE